MQEPELMPSLDPLAGSAAGSRFLSSSSYRVLLSASGTGGSWFGKHALTRWVADPVEDSNGFSIYIRDLMSGRFWSAGAHPTHRPANRYVATWEPGLFQIEREDEHLAMRLEVAVASEAPMELRRLTLTNQGKEPRRVELTSYIEISLAEPQSFAAHPAFSKLFVQTKWLRSHAAVLARRRPRSQDETHPCLVHALLDGEALEYETDRVRFLVRGGSRSEPRILREGDALSGTCGNVLDPIASLRCVVSLDPGETRRATFVLGAATDLDAALAMLERFRAAEALEATFSRAKHHARSFLDRLGIAPEAAAYDQALAGALLYGSPRLRGTNDVAARARGGKQDLERLGLIPERPFVLLHAGPPAGAALLPRLRQAQRHWHALGLAIDLVVLAGEGSPANLTPGEGAEKTLHLLDGRLLHENDRALLHAWARAVVQDRLPSLHSEPGRRVQAFAHSASPEPGMTSRPGAPPRENLQHPNGLGGFSADGRQFVLRLRGADGRLHGQPPQPWVNILANEEFGTLVSETGAGATWSGNSREHRLTPWFNDPLLDPHGEALYLRDEVTGAFWSPLPGPAPCAGDYEVRHGFGWSSFSHESHGLLQNTRIFVPRRDPMKITTLCLRNETPDQRRFSLFTYRHLVLADLPESNGRAIFTWHDEERQTLLARNVTAGAYAGAVAFASLVPHPSSHVVAVSCDRASFLGASGSLTAPAAMGVALLDGATGAGLVPCFAQQMCIELAPLAEVEIHLLFGEGRDEVHVGRLLEGASTPGAIASAARHMESFWDELLQGLQIETPLPRLDVMVNGWLPYQTLACRLWARSALYQSGGAFGFRDQLQDAASLSALQPRLTRSQILLHGAHQFVEGDVLHWWHPPEGRGTRTRFADDLLWLPYLTAHYIDTTGDWDILDEPLPFLQARALAPQEDEAYLLPEKSGSRADLYEHCCRAIDRSLKRGIHGLPLFGSGDWNDGMNRVGHEGRGESVWMGFFLYAVLGDFLPLCDRRGDNRREALYRRHRQELRGALEESAWDGEWYRRGYYDNGQVLGSSQNQECRIDALVQAWAVLSGAADRNRASVALDGVERHLLSEADGIIRLLRPPFENAAEDPGYIKGYVPGVRENGGQYTHAALWVVRALAELGRNERVAPLLERLTPLWHARDPESVATYQVEPYVVAADIYGEPPHVGRGGWTWYTGSSGWMFRVIVESLLGMRLVQGEFLEMAPCVPDAWPGFRIFYRLPNESTRYEIFANNPRRRGLGVFEAWLDGVPLSTGEGTARIPLQHDGAIHRIELVLGAP